MSLSRTEILRFVVGHFDERLRTALALQHSALNSHDVEEIVANTYTVLCTKIEAGTASCFLEKQSADQCLADIQWIRAFVFSVGMHLAQDYVRGLQRYRRHVKCLPDLPDQPDPRREIQPAMVTERNEVCKAVQVALDRLPEHVRQVITLKIWGQLTFEEVAGIIHIPLGTVRTRYYAGKQSLQALLCALKPEH